MRRGRQQCSQPKTRLDTGSDSPAGKGPTSALAPCRLAGLLVPSTRGWWRRRSDQVVVVEMMIRPRWRCDQDQGGMMIRPRWRRRSGQVVVTHGLAGAAGLLGSPPRQLDVCRLSLRRLPAGMGGGAFGLTRRFWVSGLRFRVSGFWVRGLGCTSVAWGGACPSPCGGERGGRGAPFLSLSLFLRLPPLLLLSR